MIDKQKLLGKIVAIIAWPQMKAAISRYQDETLNNIC